MVLVRADQTLPHPQIATSLTPGRPVAAEAGGGAALPPRGAPAAETDAGSRPRRPPVRYREPRRGLDLTYKCRLEELPSRGVGTPASNWGRRGTSDSASTFFRRQTDYAELAKETRSEVPIQIPQALIANSNGIFA